jgi:hypothetical protein
MPGALRRPSLRSCFSVLQLTCGPRAVNVSILPAALMTQLNRVLIAKPCPFVPAFRSKY